MEFWDIYDENKQLTGRMMKRNDWCLKDGEYHLTVLGVIAYLFTYKRENPDEGDNYFVDVYRFVMDIDENDVSFQEAEIDGYMFATKEQIEGFAAEGKFLHYDSIKQAFSFEK